jgi:ornithine--oxo-acid transaminase
MDFLSAYSAVNQGHRHPHIIDALKHQADRVTLTSRAFYNDRMGDFLEKLCDYTGYDMALPMNTGAEAVETALKMARLWGHKVKGIEDGKQEIICLEENFHGRTITIVSFSTDPDARTGFGPYTPGFEVVPYDDAAAIEGAVTEHTVAVLIEPIQGEAGVNVPAEGYLREVREICTRHEILMIADEVQTGFCRTGRKFAVDHEGVRPDAMCLGKALGGGVFPVSAVVADHDVLGVFWPGSHGSTFGGNPLGAAVAIASIEVLENENLAQKAEADGIWLREQLGRLVDEVPRLKGIRGKGLLNAVIFDEGFEAWNVCVALKEKGLLAKQTHGNIIRFAPPLIISREELEQAVSIIRECFLAID